jgi:hypothetical protein
MTSSKTSRDHRCGDAVRWHHPSSIRPQGRRHQSSDVVSSREAPGLLRSWPLSDLVIDLLDGGAITPSTPGIYPGRWRFVGGQQTLPTGGHEVMPASGHGVTNRSPTSIGRPP